MLTKAWKIISNLQCPCIIGHGNYLLSFAAITRCLGRRGEFGGYISHVMWLKIQIEACKLLCSAGWGTQLYCIPLRNGLHRLEEPPWHLRQFKGTVPRDAFGFWGHAWWVLGLNRGRDHFLNFLGAPMILKRQKVYYLRSMRFCIGLIMLAACTWSRFLASYYKPYILLYCKWGNLYFFL